MSETDVIEKIPIKVRRQSDGSDLDCDLQFKPIITLPEVEISTNEENEKELLKIRAKLYRFDSSNDQPEWKERGTGELKMLQHKINNAVRIVMRRDKTFKVCANHFITPWMELKPSIGSEKAFVYTVLADFADEEIKSECLAVKFASIDNANLFKTRFEEAKVILKTECDLYNGKADKENGLATNGEDDYKIIDSEDTECVEVIKKISQLDVAKDEK